MLKICSENRTSTREGVGCPVTAPGRFTTCLAAPPRVGVLFCARRNVAGTWWRFFVRGKAGNMIAKSPPTTDAGDTILAMGQTMANSAEHLLRAGQAEEARRVFWAALDTTVKGYYLIKTGKLWPADAAIQWCMKTLRAGGHIEKPVFDLLAKVMGTKNQNQWTTDEMRALIAWLVPTGVKQPDAPGRTRTLQEAKAVYKGHVFPAPIARRLRRSQETTQ